MGRFWTGFLTGWAVLLLGALIIISSGLTPVSAVWMHNGHGWLKTFLAYTSRRAIEASAESQKNPFEGNQEAMLEGAKDFKKDCLHCHGAPGVKRDEWSEGLVPHPPDLDSKRIQTLTDGEVFWVVKNGLHSTGMPNFSHEKDEDLWKIVSFIKSITNLPPEVKKEIQSPETGEKDQSGSEAPSS